MHCSSRNHFRNFRHTRCLNSSSVAASQAIMSENLFISQLMLMGCARSDLPRWPAKCSASEIYGWTPPFHFLHFFCNEWSFHVLSTPFCLPFEFLYYKLFLPFSSLHPLCSERSHMEDLCSNTWGSCIRRASPLHLRHTRQVDPSDSKPLTLLACCGVVERK